MSLKFQRQCPTHYSPTGNGDVLDIVVHQNAWLSEIIVSVVLGSDLLPIVFHILGHVRTTNLSDPIKKSTDRERLQSLASDLMSPKIQNISGLEADKAARLYRRASQPTTRGPDADHGTSSCHPFNIP
jgi:hypothetical protein